MLAGQKLAARAVSLGAWLVRTCAECACCRECVLRASLALIWDAMSNHVAGVCVERGGQQPAADRVRGEADLCWAAQVHDELASARTRIVQEMRR